MQRASSGPPKVSKWRLQDLAGLVLVLLVGLCTLNVVILEGSQRKTLSLGADVMKASDLSKRRLYWMPPPSHPFVRPALNDVKTLESNSAHTVSPAVPAGSSSGSPADPSVQTLFGASGIPQSDTVPSIEKHSVAATVLSSDQASSSKYQAAREKGAIAMAIPDPALLQSETDKKQASAPQSVEHRDSSENTSPRRNLVLGFAQGVDGSNLAVFVSSLRNASSCTIVLFTNTLSDEETNLFGKYDVVPARFELGQLEPRQVRSYQTENYRWFLFRKYLEDNGGVYDNVLIADVDDTAFQSDPFVVIDRARAQTGAEGEQVFVASNNLKWIDKGRTVALLQVCYGKLVANQLGGEEVTDNGVVLGTTAALKSYLALLTVSMTTPEFAACQKKGSDQVAHHVLQHSATVPGLHVLKQKDGLIAHLEGAKTVLYKNSTVVNDHEELVPIVHQYDVDVKIAQKLFGSFFDKDFRLEKKGKGKCRAYMMQSNVLPYSSDSVLVHFAPEPAISLDRCCEMCTAKSTSGCVGFIFDKLKSTCRFKGTQTSTPREVGLVMPGATSGLLVR